MPNTITLIDLTLWVDRIKAQCPAFGGHVFQTIPDDELTIDQHQSPVAFVYLSGDDSDENSLKTGAAVRQKMTSHVTVEIVIRRTATKADPFNGASVSLIRQYRMEIFNALIGWKPTDTIKPVQHVKGNLLKKEPKTLKWPDTFSTENMILKQT